MTQLQQIEDLTTSNVLENNVKQKINFEKKFIPQKINKNEKNIISTNELLNCENGSIEKIQFVDGISLIEQRQYAVLKIESAAICLQICKTNAVKEIIYYLFCFFY